jgi:hypothetical protein
MPAYKKTLIKPKCRECSSPARFEVFNRFNASCGFFCSGHAEREIRRLNADEMPGKAR